MQRSPELEAISRRVWEAQRVGDVDSFTAHMSRSDDGRWVGSDPAEFWSGFSVFSEILKAQSAEIGPDLPMEIHSVEAWEEGTVGWTVGIATVGYPTGPRQARLTLVWHMESSQWKLVHANYSVGVDNVETVGKEITTSVDILAQAVEVERPDLGVASAPDGTVTLMFTDIEGSTERNQVLGDREWMGVLRHHHDLIREHVAANDGFEVKSMGDGFMVAFSSARRALRCAMDIQRAIEKEPELDVLVRCGLHAGEAVRDGDDFYGATVNMAARVAGQAAGGEVLVSSLVKALVESSGEFTFGPPRAAELKGIAGTHDLHPLSL